MSQYNTENVIFHTYSLKKIQQRCCGRNGFHNFYIIKRYQKYINYKMYDKYTNETNV